MKHRQFSITESFNPDTGGLKLHNKPVQPLTGLGVIHQTVKIALTAASLGKVVYFYAIGNKRLRWLKTRLLEQVIEGGYVYHDVNDDGFTYQIQGKGTVHFVNLEQIPAFDWRDLTEPHTKPLGNEVVRLIDIEALQKQLPYIYEAITVPTHEAVKEFYHERDT